MYAHNVVNDRKMAERFLHYVRSKSAFQCKDLYIDKRFIKEERQNLPQIECISKKLQVASEFNTTGGREAFKRLFLAFGRFCRINDIEYPEQYREQVSTILAAELTKNARVFSKKMAPTEATLKQCTPLTVYHGTTYCDVFEEEEFSILRRPFPNDEERSLHYPFRQAMLRMPTDPRRYLREAVKRINEFMETPLYEALADNPSYIVSNAIYHPNTFEERIREAILRRLDKASDDDSIAIETMIFTEEIDANDMFLEQT